MRKLIFLFGLGALSVLAIGLGLRAMEQDPERAREPGVTQPASVPSQASITAVPTGQHEFVSYDRETGEPVWTVSAEILEHDQDGAMQVRDLTIHVAGESTLSGFELFGSDSPETTNVSISKP